MDSLSVVLRKLKSKDQANEVIIRPGGVVTLNDKTYKQKDLVILRTYRFEGDSDPGDAAIIYLVKANDGDIGYCLDGYGMYSSHTSDFYGDFIRNAKIVAAC